MTGVRGCIMMEICLDVQPLDSAGLIVTSEGGDRWYPFAGLANCRQCVYKYGSKQCKEWREGVNAKVIIT